jgi:hypothetical protein
MRAWRYATANSSARRMRAASSSQKHAGAIPPRRSCGSCSATTSPRYCRTASRCGRHDVYRVKSVTWTEDVGVASPSLPSCSAKRMFSGLMSRRTMSRAWRYAMANSSTRRMRAASSSQEHAGALPPRLLWLLLRRDFSMILSNSPPPRPSRCGPRPRPCTRPSGRR